MPKRKVGWKKVVATGVITTSLGLGFWASKAFYTVKEVIDGDTFITTENRYVRLDSINTPELEFCLGKEAKEEMEKLVLNKKVFLKVTYVDDRKRLVASVYTLNGNVGEKLLEKGLATFNNKGTLTGTSLPKTEVAARKAKIGIFSPICTQTENPDNPKCNIKGNIVKNGMFYHYPGCGQYGNTLVHLHLGEKWICTEKEAIKAGFAKGKDCY